MSEIKKRMMSQDIAKGIAISIVVLLHLVEVPNIVRIIVGALFGYAMPFFLFMTGFNYKNRGLSPWLNIKRRLIQIIKPLLTYTLIISVIMSFHFVLNGEATIYECIRSYIGFLLTKWGTPYIGWDLPKILFQRTYGPLWFLQFLIPSTVIFYLFVDKALKNNKNFFIIIATLSTISAILCEVLPKLPWGLQDSPAIAAIMIIAAWCKKDDKLFKNPGNKKYKIINSIIAIAIIGLTELLFNGAGYVMAGEMSDVLGGIEIYVTLLVSVLGSYFIINFSSLIEKVPVVSNIFVWLGQHSLQILLLHLSIAHLVIDAFGYEQMMTEFPMPVDKVSIDDIVTCAVTMAIIFIIVTLIEKLPKLLKKN